MTPESIQSLIGTAKLYPHSIQQVGAETYCYVKDGHQHYMLILHDPQLPPNMRDVFSGETQDFDANTAGVQGRANPTATLFVNGPAPGGVLVEDTFYYDAASGKLSLSTDADGFADFTVTLNVEQTVVTGRRGSRLTTS